ncbi:MAG TPA: alpha/beta hydrolase [Symbiobacteriaceae bacterium]|nr:alpha/beta hydrolase [Symbiobacteriaceae bacterium]
MPYVEHIYYEETGAGRPLILIHCPALSHIYWRPVMERLAPVCRCIGIDLRGHGRSGRGDEPWTFADIAADLAMFTRTLNLEQPVLVGYSAGGAIALLTAAEEPDLFGGVVAVSSFSECCTLSMKIKVNLGLAAIALGLVPMIGPNIISTNSAGKAHMQAMLPDARGVNPVSLRCFLKETLTCSFTEKLHRVKAPVLLVQGTKDDWMHGYYRTLHRELPDARAIFFPDCDHRVPTRHPQTFADAVAEFLSQIDPAAADEPQPVLPPFMHPGIMPPPLHPKA